MGFSDTFSDFLSSFSFPELHAEAPPKDDEQEDGEEEKSGDDAESAEEGGEESEEGGDDESAEGEGEEEEGEEDEEEEEEDEPVDLKPMLEEECAKSSQCAGVKHHYDECAERVTAQHENPDHKGPKEDCVEEFFHLQHCATQCAAPKLFRQLK